MTTPTPALLSIPPYEYEVIDAFLETHPGRGAVDQEPIRKEAGDYQKSMREAAGCGSNHRRRLSPGELYKFIVSRVKL
jgi:hypothetical protein